MNVKKEKERRTGGRVTPLLAAVLFLVGAAVLLYPAVSNYLAEKNQAVVVQNYEQAVQENNKEALEEEWRKAEVYNESLAGDPVKDPFVPGSGYALPQNYQDVLNIEGVMGYVEIPKIDVKLPIYHGTTEEVLEKGVGHIESTALPIGGAYRHTVLTGHRGLPSAELFTRLDELKKGDIFLIHVLDQTHAYKVDQIKTVLPSQLEDIQAVEGRDLVTLLTCTPYGINTHRLLVRGERTEYVPEEMKSEGGASLLDSLFNGKWQYIGILLGLFLLLIGFLIWRMKEAKRKQGGRHGRNKRKNRKRQ
ncbi:class C sortase [Eubacterium sp.]|uniref:class C sortase n=1 Tax=Eubacterium sp. TaxID=142586 RepID=UPI0026E0992E|nr:class C sortase [Eubacterium sp.]MDO5433015.1 class C sortase [Eubacterium sp.]